MKIMVTILPLGSDRLGTNKRIDSRMKARIYFYWS